MRSKVPNTSQLNPRCARVTRRARAASAAVAAALLLLSCLPLAGAASSAASRNRPRQKKPAGTPATPAQQTAPTPQPNAEPSEEPADDKGDTAGKPDDQSKSMAGQRVKLYYLRAGTNITKALNEIAKADGSPLKGLVVNVVAEDEINLFGNKDKRDLANRVITTFDLPRPGIQMEMWGVQMSSKRPEELAEVMLRVRFEIDQTQQEVRLTYARMQELARDINDLDPDFQKILTEDLKYKSALDPNRPLSFSDILLRLIAANDPPKAAETLANNLDAFLADLDSRRDKCRSAFNVKRCQEKLREAAAKGEAPPPRPSFQHFFTARGLFKAKPDGSWEAPRSAAFEREINIGRVALLDFAVHYGQLVHEPEKFDPYYLQQSAGTLNARLQQNIDALNRDMQEVFVVPTLDRIRRIAAEFDDVSYAQVGRTTVASISGAEAKVTSGSVNTFDFTRPLDLAEWLKTAKTLSDSVGGFVPNPTENVVGAMPYAQLIGLVGALGADRTETRKTKSGISVTITPNVLRNMTSAELDVNLTTGDPLAGDSQQAGTPQFSRISQHDVDTTVYVNALDFFDLSAFGSQATMNGGRGYVPVIGPFWRGLFGEAPVIGEFLSWKKKPQSVYSQSLALTTSFITPTAMGVALLVPTENPAKDQPKGCDLFKEVRREIGDYGIGLFNPSKKQTLVKLCQQNGAGPARPAR